MLNGKLSITSSENVLFIDENLFGETKTFNMENFSLYAYLRESMRYDDIERQIAFKEFDKNTYIYNPGDSQKHIYLIDSGVVKIGSYDENGDEVVYDVLIPGEIFGNLKYLNDHFFEYARALCGCRLLAFNRDFFKQIIVNDPKVSEWFNITIVKRWCKAETRLMFMTKGKIEARVNNIIRELSHKIKDKNGIYHQVIDLLTYEDLANLAGTTRQTLAKKLRV